MFFGKNILQNIDGEYLNYFKFHETDPSYANEIIKHNSQHNIISFDYIEPHTFWLKYVDENSSQINVDELMTLLSSDISQDFTDRGLNVPQQRLKGWLSSSLDAGFYINSVSYTWALVSVYTNLI